MDYNLWYYFWHGKIKISAKAIHSFLYIYKSVKTAWSFSLDNIIYNQQHIVGLSTTIF